MTNMTVSTTPAPPPTTKAPPTAAPTAASTAAPTAAPTHEAIQTTATTTATTGSCPCVLASALSSTFVILALIICGVLYYFYQRRKEKSTAINSRGEHTLTEQSGPNTETPNNSRYKEPRPEDNIPPLPIKPGGKNQKSDYHSNQSNQGFQSDEGYCVPPKREEPLPRKKGKKKEEPKVSPYHGSLRDQEEYSVPPTRSESFAEPPLPPNLAKKLKRQTELESSRPGSATNSDYYLDMEGVRDELYQNIGASEDDIYINN